MKLIPIAISRKIAQQGLLASENSPKVLFVGGVVGMVGSTVLACRATLKLETKLDQIEAEKEKHTLMYEHVASGNADPGLTYSEAELNKDLRIITVRGIGSVAKLYMPSVVLGAVSVAALTKSHNILQDRNLALTAAYAAVDNAYNRYRERVIERYGEDVDREIVYESEQIDTFDEDGKLISRTGVSGAPGSKYARFYDELSSSNWSSDPDINRVVLFNTQNYMNDRLKARGHLFLNEVFEELGMSHTQAGSVVGWLWNRGTGDDRVDFGILDQNKDQVIDFFNGREGAILLDFNVDGVIYNLIEEKGI